MRRASKRLRPFYRDARDVTLSVREAERCDEWGKTEWAWRVTVWLDKFPINCVQAGIAGRWRGAQLFTRRGARATLRDLAGFLSAAIESTEGETYGFPPTCIEAVQHAVDELALFSMDLEGPQVGTDGRFRPR